MSDVKKKPGEGMTAVIDLDMCKYKVASVSQKTYISVTYKDKPAVKSFDSRQEFYGHYIKKSGGWLGDHNKSRLTKGLEPLVSEDFSIEDKVEVYPLKNCLHTAKQSVPGLLELTGADDYICYLGEGDSFRVQESSVLKYKGTESRQQEKPFHMESIVKYFVKKFDAEIVTDIEADDKVVMECFKRPDRFIIGEDKDYYGQPVKFFNVRKPEEGIIDCDCFGKLWIDDKNKVRGYGRMFLYFQWASGDAVDNFKANSANKKKKWGEKSAFKRLVDCKDDVQAIKSVIDIYKEIYPGEVKFTHWRSGKDIITDWKYVANENFIMARMLRFEGDKVDCMKLLALDEEEISILVGG